MATTTPKRSRRKAPTVQVSLAKFDTRDPVYRVVREAVPIQDFVPLTAADYAPSGGTPLRDAVARMIGHGDKLRGPGHVTILALLDESASMGGNRGAVIEGMNQFVDGMSDVKSVDPKTAGTVLAVVFTDGEENSSREVDHPTLQQMIKEREEDGWTFIFLGANIDAWHQGTSLGFSGGVRGQTISYVNTPQGTRSAMSAVTKDSADYLTDSAAFYSSKVTTGTTQSSVTESGAVLSANINASSSSPYTQYNVDFSVVPQKKKDKKEKE